MSTLAATAEHLVRLWPVAAPGPTGRRENHRGADAAPTGNGHQPCLAQEPGPAVAVAPVEEAALHTYWVAG